MEKFFWLCTIVLLSLWMNKRTSAEKHNSASCTPDEDFSNCQNDRYIPLRSIRDNHNDCGDDSDEDSTSCEISYQAFVDTTRCTDRNLPTSNGPTCFCPEGYKLADNQTCVNIKDGTQILTIGGIDTDVSLNETYILKTHWAIGNETRNIGFKTFMDRLAAEWIKIEEEKISEYIAVDWITGNIYFIDKHYSQMGVCTNSGSYCTLIIDSRNSDVRALALHSATGKMYWSQCGDEPRIYKADMNGKSRVSFVRDNLNCPDYLTINYRDRRLYWVDKREDIIESTSLDGTDRRSVVRSNERLMKSTAIYESTFFWTKWIQSTSNCKTGAGEIRVPCGFYDMWWFQIDHTLLEFHFDNPCNGDSCEEICLLSANNKYTCACSPYKTLGEDGKSCKRVKDVNHLIVAAKGVLIDYHHQILRKPYWVIINTSDHFAEVYNPNNQSLSSNNSQMIFDEISSIYGSNETIGGVAFDHIGNNLYSVNVQQKRIEVMSLETLENTFLEFSEEPRSILLIPELSIMFVTFCNVSGCHIDKMSMTGNESTRFLKDDFVGPQVSLAFDAETKRVLWADQGTGRIESISPGGTDRNLLYSNITEPVSLAIFGAEIFWTQKNSKKLFWMKKTDSYRSLKSELMPIEVDIMHLITMRGNYETSGSTDQLGQTAGKLLLLLLLLRFIL